MLAAENSTGRDDVFKLRYLDSFSGPLAPLSSQRLATLLRLRFYAYVSKNKVNLEEPL